MKKFGRFFSGIAAIMLGVGILMIVFGIKGTKAYWEKQDNSRDVENMSHMIYAAEKIKMDIPYGIVEIGMSSDSGAVQFYGENIDKDSVIIHEDQGEIAISVKDSYERIRLFNLEVPIFSGMEFGKLNRREKTPVYTLLLPWNYVKELDIHVDYGELSVDGVWTESMKLNVNLGEIKVEESYAKNLELLCHAGRAYAKGDFLTVDAEVELGDLDLILFGEKEIYSGHLSGRIGNLVYGATDFSGNRRYYKHQEGLIIKEEKFSGNGDGKVSLSCKVGNIGLWFLEDIVYQDVLVTGEAEVQEGCLENWEYDQNWNSGLGIAEDWGNFYDFSFQDLEELEAELSEVFSESDPEEDAKKAALFNIVNVLELYDWKREKTVCDIMANQKMDDLEKGTVILEALRGLSIKEEKMKEAAQIMLDDIDSQDWKDENRDILDKLYESSGHSYWKELESRLEDILENSDLNDSHKRMEITNILEAFEVGNFSGI